MILQLFITKDIEKHFAVGIENTGVREKYEETSAGNVPSCPRNPH
jgi:hypothetical protein